MAETCASSFIRGEQKKKRASANLCAVISLAVETILITKHDRAFTPGPHRDHDLVACRFPRLN